MGGILTVADFERNKRGCPMQNPCKHHDCNLPNVICYHGHCPFVFWINKAMPDTRPSVDDVDLSKCEGTLSTEEIDEIPQDIIDKVVEMVREEYANLPVHTVHIPRYTLEELRDMIAATETTATLSPKKIPDEAWLKMYEEKMYKERTYEKGDV